MKTICIALLVFVGAASCVRDDAGAPARLTFLPADEVMKNPEGKMHDAQNPANHVFPTIPTVPFRPLCISEGYFRDPYNCGKFYRCGGSQAVPYALYCSPGFVFNMKTSWCDWPELVEC